MKFVNNAGEINDLWELQDKSFATQCFLGHLYQGWMDVVNSAGVTLFCSFSILEILEKQKNGKKVSV